MILWETDMTADVEQTDTCDTEKMDEKTDTSSDFEEKPVDPMANESHKDNSVNTEELEADSKGEYLVIIFIRLILKCMLYKF